MSQNRNPTKRALDAGESARFTCIFLASSFLCSQAESTPAPAPVTQTVGRLGLVFIHAGTFFLSQDIEDATHYAWTHDELYIKSFE